ncbi:MAG: ABC transporter substrate-binding protein [Spirochaetaceae bacterium]|jgi:NitT/TauT family transport system substrate-binding protein|nr:ABC transporter substrate-binding protein [Spirochaetaceae bacterium]
MKRLLWALVVCGLLVLPLWAKGGKAPPPEADDDLVLRVAALNGPSAIPMAYLFEHPPVLDGMKTAFEVEAGPDILLPKMLKGEIDVGVLPINLAAKTYGASKGAVVLGAIMGNGMVSLVTKDRRVTSLGSLRGKRVHVAGQGATPDYVFRYLLKEAGLAEGEVTLDYSIPPAEIPQALLSGRIGYAVLPEPFSTAVISRDPAFCRAIDFQKEFALAQGDPQAVYPMTALVVISRRVKKYPKTVRLFLDALKDAIAWTNAHPEEAGELAEKHTPQGAAAARAIPSSAFVYTGAVDAMPSVEALLGIFLDSDVDSVGGALPDRGFYFE